jgi:hypothetical protein
MMYSRLLLFKRTVREILNDEFDYTHAVKLHPFLETHGSIRKYLEDNCATKITLDRQTPKTIIMNMIYHQKDNTIFYIIFIHCFPELEYLQLASDYGTLFKMFSTILYALCVWDEESPSQEKIMMNRTVRRLETIIQRTEMESLFVRYISFNVMGCPTSTDIDVCVAVTEQSNIHGNIDIRVLSKELESLGYDISTRKIDVNAIYVEDDSIVEVNHGNKEETQSIIYHTYSLHKQLHPCLVSHDCELDIYNKIRSIAKYILDNLDQLIPSEVYSQVRPEKTHSYGGYWNGVDFVTKYTREIIDYLESLSYEDGEEVPYKLKSHLKTLTMKILQLYLLHSHGTLIFTKPELALEFDRMLTDSDRVSASGMSSSNALFFLMRGTQGTYNEDIISFLLTNYVDISSLYEPESRIWHSLNEMMDITINPTALENELFSNFLKSPITATDLFCEEFKKVCPDMALNGHFPLECLNVDKLDPDFVSEHVEAVDQRSPEWLSMLKYYQCGQNSATKEYDSKEDGDWVAYHYNLIRGCISEMIITNNTDFTDCFAGETIISVDKIMVGLLVKEKKEKSLGIAPDLHKPKRSI